MEVCCSEVNEHWKVNSAEDRRFEVKEDKMACSLDEDTFVYHEVKENMYDYGSNVVQERYVSGFWHINEALYTADLGVKEETYNSEIEVEKQTCVSDFEIKEKNRNARAVEAVEVKRETPAICGSEVKESTEEVKEDSMEEVKEESMEVSGFEDLRESELIGRGKAY